ncbi:MAG: hypothetical protein ACLVD3_10920 [Hominilimicola sp.]|uniref:hypothetical protein n=1 Tax=Hominilimicola sp. TaxID=3073571 RepID=UPI00399A4894
MDYELKNKLVKIISKNILTPVIYMIENDNLLDFICFCDRNIKMQEIYNVEQQIKEVTNKNVEIIDIREFGESERIEVINQATLIYSEHPLIEKIFAQSMMEDFKIAMDGKTFSRDIKNAERAIYSKTEVNQWKRIL